MARPRQVSDDEILNVARDVFVEHGPGASTQVIADAVGLSQPALFKRFGTKKQLMIKALMPPSDVVWLEESFPAPSGDGKLALRALVTRMLGHLMKFAPSLAAIHASGMSPLELFADYPEPPPVTLRRRLVEWFIAGRDAGVFADARYPSLSLALMGAMQGRVMLQHMVNIDVPDTYPSDLVDLFWAQLAPAKENA